jgi:DNA (cytosine-5)-methyltransferase 1
MRAISLFSSAGLGDLGIVKSGIEIVISSELLENRHKLYAQNFPSVKCITGDIWETVPKIIEAYREKYDDKELFMIYATPPCQGMSTNGAGTLLKNIRNGTRPHLDERNRLVIPMTDIACELKPRWLLMENVPNMANTIIQDEYGEYVNIIDYIAKRLGTDYVGKASVVTCSDYGIPQRRPRLITIFTRDEDGKRYLKRFGTFFPSFEKQPQVTLRQAIGNFPPLSAEEGKNARLDFNPYHYVPIMKKEKLWWIHNTPEGSTAYNNQCINPDCGYQGNPGHKDVVNDGIAQASTDIPIFCAKCGQLLPRPSLIDKITNERRLLKGFHSAYRRMKWDEPAPTLTQNFIYEASDNKVHPEQDRVLSFYEALVIQTISQYDYNFMINGKPPTNAFFAEIIGESVPPKLIQMICEKIINIKEKADEKTIDTIFY